MGAATVSAGPGAPAWARAGAHQPLVLRQRPGGLRPHDAADVGQLDPGRTPGEQLHAQRPLQLLHLPAQRGLGEPEPGGGAAEVALRGDGQEGAQQAGVDVGVLPRRRRHGLGRQHAPTVARRGAELGRCRRRIG
jgi:hypothetical protein